MGSSSTSPISEELILKSYGLLDSSTIEQLSSSLKKECSTKTAKKVPPRLVGIRHEARNSLKEKQLPLPKGGFHERAIATINASRLPSEKALKSRSHYFQASLSSRKEIARFPLKLKSSKLNGYTKKKFAELRNKFKTTGEKQLQSRPEIHIVCSNKPSAVASNGAFVSNATSVSISKPQVRDLNGKMLLQTPAVDSSFMFNNPSESIPDVGPGQERLKRRHQATEGSDICIFCGLPLYDTLSIEGKEQAIDLSCEHQSHEQCLLLEMELKNMGQHESADTAGSGLSVDEGKVPDCSYPPCPKCNNGVIAVPKDPEIKDRLGVQILLYPKTNLFQKLLGKRTATDIGNGFDEVTNDVTMPAMASPVALLSSNSSSNSELSNKPDFYPSEEPPLIPPDWVLSYDVEDLRKKLVTDLSTMVKPGSIHSVNDDLTLTQSLLNSFGPLRLLDKISFKFEDHAVWSSWYCYFFKHMLVFLKPVQNLFALFPITPFIRVQVVSKFELWLFGGQRNSISVHLKSCYSGLIDKWRKALEDNKALFGVESLTSTVDKNEFKSTLDKLKKNEAPNIVHQRNVPKVDKKLYEYTFSTLNSDDTPDNIVIMINKADLPTKESFIAVVNIMRCLKILDINMAAIFSSIHNPTWDSTCQNLAYFEDSDFEDNAAQLKKKILAFQNDVNDVNSTDDNSEHNTVKNLVGSAIDNWKVGKTMLIVLSDTRLDNFHSAGIQSVLIEINTKLPGGNSQSQIINILDWEDIMEVICDECHLDFDDICSDDSAKDDGITTN